MSSFIGKFFNRNFFEPIICGVILFLIVGGVLFVNSGKKNIFIQDELPKRPVLESVKVIAPQVSTSTKSTKDFLNLNVPYVSEAPDNLWIGPWKNACEEASVTMVEKYYKGEKTVNITEAKNFMQNLFDVQDKLYGSNANSDVVRTNFLVNNYSSFKGVIKSDPTIDDIKKQLDGGYPVIAFHNGFDLKNPNIPFLPTGSAYHSTVVEGYDDVSKEFIVDDPGDEIQGTGHRYGYDLYMNSLHDYNYSDKKADGPARVIFTSSN